MNVNTSEMESFLDTLNVSAENVGKCLRVCELLAKVHRV